ncbi:hypothetical protein EPUL_004035 [Erysiphe pulchra]|uniref:Reverse transcriptase domain-containing protein n=1 Tax=Erysiphe pulchra TaxID=225359 RepID=A0A2S4PV03_9PEZI|nr:hypothetical protein EPUL_004035 [Erysiphe pulchra]
MGIPTHNRGGTTDLTFCLDERARCEIRPDLHTTSDHETLAAKLRYKDLNNELFLRLLGNNQYPPEISSRTDLEIEASTIIKTIHTALVSACPKKGSLNYGTPWWNEDCRLTVRAYRRARRDGQAIPEKFNFKNGVRKSLSQAYKIVKWYNAAPRYLTPSLRHEVGSETVSGSYAKAQLLHQTLLSRQYDLEDIPLDTPAVPKRSISLETISIKEAFKATCQASTTSPGEDELTTTCLRLAWPILGDHITNFFNKCIELGIHPSAFKRAIAIILPKSGRRDRSISKSYEPISLLSCLGKGLERLVARRLSYWALQLQVLARDQCCTTSHRSASDRTTVLLCDNAKRGKK